MASPGDARDPPTPGDSAFTANDPAAEDLERFAQSFRPSWELDEAPFGVAPPLAPSEISQLAGNDLSGQVRALLAEGGQAPAAGSSQRFTNDAVAPVTAHGIEARARPVIDNPPSAGGARPAPVPVSAPAAIASAADLPRRTAMSVPAVRAPLPSLELYEIRAIRGASKRPLWIAVGVVAAALVLGLGLWAVSGSNATTNPAGGTTTAERPTAEKAQAASPASAEPQAQPPALPPTPEVPPSTTTAVPTHSPPPPALLNPPPMVAAPAAVAPPRPTPAIQQPPPQRPVVAPKAPSRTKPGTIVRDVPF